MVLSIKGLNKSFGNKKVLNNLSYDFKNGIHGLLAPNGEGKTTLLRCICGLYNVSSNTIFFDDLPIKKLNDYSMKIGYLPQNFGMFKEFTVNNMLELSANLKGINKKEAASLIDDVLEKVNLEGEKHKKISTLSGGMIRRVGIAQALIGNPDILIFDEPTAGLDPEERLRFKNIVFQLGNEKIIIISTHIVEDVETLCDNILILKNGIVTVSGSCDTIANCAKDKLYILPKEEILKLNTPYSIQRYFDVNGKKYARVLSSENLPYEKAEPSVEDGYLCILKKF